MLRPVFSEGGAEWTTSFGDHIYKKLPNGEHQAALERCQQRPGSRVKETSAAGIVLDGCGPDIQRLLSYGDKVLGALANPIFTHALTQRAHPDTVVWWDIASTPQLVVVHMKELELDSRPSLAGTRLVLFEESKRRSKSHIAAVVPNHLQFAGESRTSVKRVPHKLQAKGSSMQFRQVHRPWPLADPGPQFGHTVPYPKATEASGPKTARKTVANRKWRQRIKNKKRATACYQAADPGAQRTQPAQPAQPAQPEQPEQPAEPVEAAEAAQREEETECIICMEAERSVVYVPCGHMVVCLKGAQQLCSRSPDCPVCAVAITSMICL